jgi:hypothetical protein
MLLSCGIQFCLIARQRDFCKPANIQIILFIVGVYAKTIQIIITRIIDAQ